MATGAGIVAAQGRDLVKEQQATEVREPTVDRSSEAGPALLVWSSFSNARTNRPM